jgi:uncharacterized membrane protein YheB (UPF0754 family)
MNGVQALIQIAVSAAIGGVTNHLAIKMLFRPRKAWKLGGIQVPFTPGLIPRRQPELAKAMAIVVRDYLLTVDGMSNSIRKDALRKSVIEALRNGWREAAARNEGREMTVGGMLGVVTDLKVLLRRIYAWEVEQREVWFQQIISHLWELPFWDQPLHAFWKPDDFGPLSDKILHALKAWLDEEGTRKELEKQVQQLIAKLGGMLGPLAAMFLNAEKLVDQFLPVIQQYVDDPAIRDGLNERLEKIWLEESDKSLRHWVGQMWPAIREPAADHRELARLAAAHVTLKPLVGLVMRQPVSTHWAEQQLQGVWELLADRFLEGIPAVMKDVPLAELVENNVNQLSLERVEQLIFALIGQEFRGITWFGVLFGAIIGAAMVLLDLIG